jgi:DUF4097 and DUF4098 domain-containing protein YvlB
MRIRILIAFLTLAAPAIASAQRSDAEWLDDCRNNRWNNDRDSYCEVRTANPRLNDGALSVDARQGGGISIYAWDKNTVEVHERISAQASSTRAAEDIVKDIRVRISDGRIETDGPDQYRGTSWSVTYVIFVPRAVDLSLEARNGPIAINGTKGRVEARTTNGPLSLNDLAGDVHARTSNGPLKISLSGRKWDGAGLDAETTNGSLRLDIPEGYAAHLVTGTVNGPMRSDFPITLQGHISARQIDTEIGGGGPTIRALTRNGPLVLRRI